MKKKKKKLMYGPNDVHLVSFGLFVVIVTILSQALALIYQILLTLVFVVLVVVVAMLIVVVMVFIVVDKHSEKCHG